ncbi:unnamed protein product, partial [Cuscuta epithymum]
MEAEEGGCISAPSTPTTPSTPGAPLFSRFRHEMAGNGNGNGNGNGGRRNLLKSCKCFNVEGWGLEEGSLPSISCTLPSPPVSLARKVGAELIGTMILIFAGTGTAVVNEERKGSEGLLGLAVSTGLAVMIVILSTGHISGAHLNPAVTLAFAALKHFPWKHVPVYIGAQLMASLGAAFIVKAVFHPIMGGGGVTVPTSGGCGGDCHLQAFSLEFIISFNLMFVVTAVSTDTRAVGELAGIAVGATVALNILIAGETTGASMNP